MPNVAVSKHVAMNKHVSAFVAALCGVVLLVGSVSGAKADRRIALVIGNSVYNNSNLILSNPKNDAEDVATALRALGFEVIQALNANKRDMDISMAKFARLATDSDTAMFYYAGHALQYQGRNYLMPTDAEVEDEISLRYQMVAIDDVRAALDRASGVKVMVLDACRNNPIVESLRRKANGETRGFGGTRGLARIDKTQGTVIAYSTAADEVAADGTGRNSPFTTAFLRRLKEPGLEIEQMFRRVAADVNTATGGRQRPETYVSLLSDYYLNQTDRVAFDAVKDSYDPAALRDFIAKFPTSNFASDARFRLQRKELEAQEKQLQEARQREALRLLQEQSKADQESAARMQAEREAAVKFQAERESARLQAEAAQRLQDEQKRTKIAGLERQDVIVAAPPSPTLPSRPLQSPALPNSDIQPPSALVTNPKAPSAAPLQPPAVSTGQNCDQDRAKLAALRSSPSADAIVQFERELTCDRLRPQVARLRESLSITPPLAPVIAAELAKPDVVQRPEVASPPASLVNSSKILDTVPVQKPPQRLANLKQPEPLPPVVTSDRPQDCKRDEERLSRLRASPSFDAVLAFERELACDRLRAQVTRLRESLAPAGYVPEAIAMRQADRSSSTSQTEAKPPAAAADIPVASGEKSCEQDRATLARLRASQSRDELIRFERALKCDELRPQVMRLKESLGG